MKNIPRTAQISTTALALLAVTDTAFAYVGPGAGLGAIGTLIAFVGAVLLGIVGFVWYPIKRLLNRRKRAADPATAQTNSGQSDTAGKPSSKQ